MSGIFLIHALTPIRLRYFLLTLVLIPQLLFANFTIDFDNLQVTVTDGNSGEALIGVSIYTDDHQFVTHTDINGQASIETLGHRDMINFTYVGYNPIKLPYFEIRKKGSTIKMFAATTLDSIVVVGRRDDPIQEIPYQIDRITQAEIAFKNPQTAADALATNADVFIQKSQMGGGSPIVRGFEANKVLLVLDGVRMNNAIYRNGHLQNAITVDGAVLEQAEVIYGPGSLMYGSDALGGVVHFRTKDPKILYDFSDGESKTYTGLYTRFASANQEKTIHADLDYRSAYWGSFSSLTISDFGDLRAGARRPEEYPDLGKRPYFQRRVEQDMVLGPVQDPNILRETGYSQIDFLQKLKYQPKDDLYFILNLQYSTSSNVPRYDALLDTVRTAANLKWAEWYYGPQKRLMASLKTRMLGSKWLYDKGTIIAAFQKLDEDRLKRKFAGAQRTFNSEDVFVYSLTMDFDKDLNKKGTQTFSYGFDGSHNRVYSDAGKVNMLNGKISRGGVFTRYPSDHSYTTSYGGYLNYKARTRDSIFVFNAGVRYSSAKLFAKYKEADLDLINWPEAYTTTGVSTTNDAFTWGIGFNINTKDNWQIRALASTAFRAPNIDDFAKLRVQDQYAVLPNTNLTPENSISGELTIGKEIGRIRNKRGTSLYLSGTSFYTYLQDVLIRRLGVQPNGDSTIVVENEPNPIFNVQQNFNANYAFVYGVSGNLVFKVHDHWRFKSGVSFTKGREQFIVEPTENRPTVLDTLTPLAHIPPMYGNVSLLYKNDRFKVEGLVRFAGRKPIEEYAVTGISFSENKEPILDRGGTSDNPEYTPFRILDNGQIEHIGSLAWTTFNIYSSFKFNSRISLDLALENITDVHYIPFSSGISAPGRNYIVTLRGTF